MADVSLTHAGVDHVWSWCCGAPWRIHSLSSWRTLSRDSSVNSSRCADRPQHPSPSPSPSISLKGRMNTPSALSPALLRPPAPQRRTWSYRLEPASMKLTFSVELQPEDFGFCQNVTRSSSWYCTTKMKCEFWCHVLHRILCLQLRIVFCWWDHWVCVAGTTLLPCTSVNTWHTTQIWCKCEVMWQHGCSFPTVPVIHYTGYLPIFMLQFVITVSLVPICSYKKKHAWE